MIDRDRLEKSLLLGIVRDKNWDVLLLNNITKDCFSVANYELYEYIKKFANEGKYPDIRIVSNVFDISEEMLREYLMIGNLNELCDVLHNEYVKNQLEYKVGQLNDFVSEMETDPVKYIDRLSRVVEDVRQISYHTKSVDLFENIEEILKIDKSNVISTGFKELDDKLIGFKRGEELVVLAGRTGQGKEQPLSAKVLTPDGWKLMRDMEVGTVVIGGDGKPANVVGVFPQGVKDVYKIEFSDGTSAECGLDHLWKVKQFNSNKGRDIKVITLRDIISSLGDKKPYSKMYRKQFAVDYVPSNIDFNDKLNDTDIPPYILGALIGDGCLTHGNEILFSEPDYDIDIINKINDLLPSSSEMRKIRNCNNDYRLVGTSARRDCGSPVDYTYKLKELGLMGKYSNEKFIPYKYLYGTLEQRIELLHGICDTDGCSSNTNVQSLETTSKQLAKDFAELVKSLGCGVSTWVKQRGYKDKSGNFVKCKDSYTVSFRCDFNPYYCKRKADKWKSFRQIRHKFIVNISKVRQEECQCIMLDNSDHTYITNDYTITHNTWMGLKFAMSAAFQGNKVGLYSGEMSTQQLQERMLCCAKPTYTSTQEEAMKVIKEKDAFVRVITQKELRRRANVSDIEEFIIRDNLDMVVIDQLSLMEDNTSKPRNTTQTTIW